MITTHGSGTMGYIDVGLEGVVTDKGGDIVGAP
jgi:hypothetical protein